MERESNPMQALCRSGCGFYGSPATDGLCSLCFKENLKKKQQLPSTPSSLSALRDTTTAQPTISHISSPPLTDLPTDESLLWNFKDLHRHIYIEKNTRWQYDRRSKLKKNASEECSNAGSAAAGNASAAETIAAEAAAAAATSSGETDAGTGSEDKDGDKDVKKKKNRCATCRKKVGLTGFECRCGGLFCAIHRYSDKHDCSFNYREMGAQEIRRNNPVVVGEKIQKI
ncbi:unnamed protein product [Diabrotica balteata]|uniref:AN1-type zinc finger protein 6 n=1 Tax=Diabrotica balteata TaxID=107213 RepID=A0A9N9SML4_DIABA|nr:unnamed protein product [Diabrotica balteata]